MLSVIDRPVFVLGYMHSGTTALLKALGNHSQLLSCYGETRFFEFGSLIRNQFPDVSARSQAENYVGLSEELIDRGFPFRAGLRSEYASTLDPAIVSEIATRLQQTQDVGWAFCQVFQELATQRKRARFVEKTPTHVFNIPEIRRAAPNAKLLEIVRDVRDVLASKKTRRATVWTDRYSEEEKPRKHLEKAYDPLWDALSWRSAIQAGSNATGADLLRIRYEDFAREPERVLRRVCQHLELEFEPEMLDIARGVPADPSMATAERGVSASSVGRWKSVLTGGEVSLIQAATRPQLQQLGYPLASLGALDKLRVPALTARSVGELAVRLQRRVRFGGPRYAAMIVRQYAQRARTL